jgi:hypothetical protein
MEESDLRKNNDLDFIPFIKERNQQGKLIKNVIYFIF